MYCVYACVYTHFQSCITFKIHSLCAIACTYDTSIVSAFVIAWHFKAQVSNFSHAQKFTNFVGGTKLAWFRWYLLVTYIIYDASNVYVCMSTDVNHSIQKLNS